MDNLALVTWTNTEYEDVFAAYFGNLKKYFPHLLSSYVIINELSEKIDDNHIQLISDENDTYASRLIGSIEHVEEEYILYMQEDFILYDHVDEKDFIHCFNYLKNSDCSCVRLIRSSCNSLENKEEENIYKISHTESPDLSFTQQPSIWKKKDFLKVICCLNPETYRDLESYGSYDASRVMKELDLYSCFYFNESSSPRGGHFDSKVFPYIATAINKGKWNMIEYKKELEIIAQEYNIDLNQRGF